MKQIHLLLVVLLFLLWWMPAAALERGLNLNVSAQGEADDNIFLTADDPIKDEIIILKSGLTLYRHTEKFDADLSARVENLDYREQDDLDTTDEFYSTDLNWRFSSRARVGVNGSFTRDSRPDRDIEITGESLSAVERQWWQGGMDTSFSMTEKSRCWLSYKYQDMHWDEEGRSDLTAHSAGLGLDYDLGRYIDSSIMQFSLGYGSYDYDISQISYYSGVLGFSKNISELWQFSVFGGARYQEVCFTYVVFDANTLQFDIREADNEDKWGTVWGVGMDYRGERTQFGLSGSKDLMPSSDVDGSTDRTSVTIKLYYRFAEKSGVGLNGGYHINLAEAGELATQDVNKETLWASSYIKLCLFKELYLVARYSFSSLEDNEAGNNRYRRSTVMQLLYDWPVWK